MSAVLWLLGRVAAAQTCVAVDGGDTEVDPAVASALARHPGCGEVVRLGGLDSACAMDEGCAPDIARERRAALVVCGERTVVADEPWVRLHVVDAEGAHAMPASVAGGVGPVVDQLVASLRAVDVERVEQGAELDELVTVPQREASGAEAEASRGSARVSGGWSQWYDPGFDGRVALGVHVGGWLAVEGAVGSRFARVLPPDGPGAVEVIVPEVSVGIVLDPPIVGEVHPWAGLAAGACLYHVGPPAVGPGARAEVGLDWVPGAVGLALEAFAGVGVAAAGADFDATRRPVAPLAGARVGPVVRW